MTNKFSPILIIEDSDEDFEVTVWALREAGVTREILRASRCEDGLERLTRRPVPHAETAAELRPALVLLDLNLPGMDGREFLQRLRSLPEAPPVPVVVLSTSNNPRDINFCYSLGAAGYLCKPFSLQLFAQKLSQVVTYWFDAVRMPEEQV